MERNATGWGSQSGAAAHRPLVALADPAAPASRPSPWTSEAAWTPSPHPRATSTAAASSAAAGALFLAQGPAPARSGECPQARRSCRTEEAVAVAFHLRGWTDGHHTGGTASGRGRERRTDAAGRCGMGWALPARGWGLAGTDRPVWAAAAAGEWMVHGVAGSAWAEGRGPQGQGACSCRRRRRSARTALGRRAPPGCKRSRRERSRWSRRRRRW
mmetsp:Transcript_38903/g.99465  ORF Transcript_38903/g.99465 Transcript_38903/m.99465 type:complete len:215 (+) Transcript_38903:107-751(+)